MSKPLTMTVEQEREYRACCTSGGTEVDPVFAELDATRAALADERKHADAMYAALRDPDSITVERAMDSHAARRSAALSPPNGGSKEQAK